MNKHAKHPQRIIPFQRYNNPIWFVTFCTYDHKSILNSSRIYNRLLQFAKDQEERGVFIGRHVLMPDHVHLFIRLAPGFKLGATIGFLKKALSATLKKDGVREPYWQPGFFDHMIRNSESYADKWEYVYNNPVRKKLVKTAEEWPYSGEINVISL